MAAGLHPTAPLVELASGVDTLYLSGRGELAPAMLSWLDAEREILEVRWRVVEARAERSRAVAMLAMFDGRLAGLPEEEP